MSSEKTARAAINEIHDPRLRQALTELLDQGIDLRERLAEAVRLLTTLKSGTCWCGLGTGHPLIRNHDQTCYDTEAFLAKEKEKG